MELSPVHDGGKSIGIARIFLSDDLLRLVQVLLIVGVLILAADGLDVVIPLFRQDDIVLLQEPFVVFPMENGFLLLLNVLRMGLLAEIPAIMAEPDILAVQILPGPVKPRELAEMGILCGNIVSGVVWGVAERFFALCADLKREVDRIIRHPIFFVSGDEDLNVHCGLVSFPMFMYTTKRLWFACLPVEPRDVRLSDFRLSDSIRRGAPALLDSRC